MRSNERTQRTHRTSRQTDTTDMSVCPLDWVWQTIPKV